MDLPKKKKEDNRGKPTITAFANVCQPTLKAIVIGNIFKNFQILFFWKFVIRYGGGVSKLRKFNRGKRYQES